jgi:DNA invertase Pin-like site-specific DNA recombinase
MHEAKRAGIYARVSTPDQSTDVQLEALRKYCDQRGWDVASEESETASGATTKRPRREALMLSAKQRKLDVIVVWKLDRWGRSTRDVLDTVEDLKAFGVRFVSITEAIDADTPMGQLFLALCAAFAQMERELIKERVKVGIERYREINGEWGRPKSARAKSAQVLELHALNWSNGKIAKTCGISRASVIRILKDQA